MKESSCLGRSERFIRNRGFGERYFQAINVCFCRKWKVHLLFSCQVCLSRYNSQETHLQRRLFSLPQKIVYIIVKCVNPCVEIFGMYCVDQLICLLNCKMIPEKRIKRFTVNEWMKNLVMRKIGFKIIIFIQIMPMYNWENRNNFPFDTRLRFTS